MSNRGLVGVVIGGVVKASYNHNDSYPTWLGKAMLKQAAEIAADLPKFASLAIAADSPNTDATPSREQRLQLARHGIAGNGNWYDVMRDTQGELVRQLEVGFIPDYLGFAMNGGSCEWAYLVNFDTEELEVYAGCDQHAGVTGDFGRFVEQAEMGDDPIYLLKRYPLRALPEVEQFLDDMVATTGAEMSQL